MIGAQRIDRDQDDGTVGRVGRVISPEDSGPQPEFDERHDCQDDEDTLLHRPRTQKV
jgi:hypothetical protein